ncbi:MAG: type I glyceraldehyde-3-phosphate dehydrogenase [bacterium]|nr:type I glyceraldehyde-3-phosphate dehydrogenase [bacterium]
MAKRIAINGFGRIGRVVFRIIHQRNQQKNSKIVVNAINDLSDPATLAYLLKYDSVHGRFNGNVEFDGTTLLVDNQPIHISAERDPKKLPWKAFESDLVLESTGHFTSKAAASDHLVAGAKKVLISAPSSDNSADATICFGVNQQVYKPNMTVISTASCTTNCIAPIAKVLHEQFGIKKASVTTIHSYTNDQQLLDFPHKDKRRARAGALSMIPTTTGAAKAVALVLPELKGKFDGMAIRVPTPNVSCIDLVALLEKNTSVEEVNAHLLNASKNIFPGILGFTVDPVVSIDLNGTNESSIVDAGCTKVLDGNMVKILAWYDNEWGFSNRAVDLLEMMSADC